MLPSIRGADCCSGPLAPLTEGDMRRNRKRSEHQFKSIGRKQMFKDTVQWTIARQRPYKQSGSQGQIALQLMISRKTLQKMLSLISPSGNRAQPVRTLPLGPWISTVDRIVRENEMRPKGAQVSAKMIWQYLKEERGFTGSFSTVNAYVRQARIMSRFDTSPGH